MDRLGCVYLVGAGPGDPGLMTLKGRELLSLCDVVVYDHLASERFLDEVPEESQRIYVGKKAGCHYMKQAGRKSWPWKNTGFPMRQCPA